MQSEADAKQSAGELLYGLIFAKTNPMLAGKITGMLIEEGVRGEGRGVRGEG